MFNGMKSISAILSVFFLVFTLLAAAQDEAPRNSPARELQLVRAIPFERMDADASGELTEIELPIPIAPSLTRADKNKSGGLDPKELSDELDRLRTRIERGPALDANDLPKDWSQLDAALDTFVAHHELDGAALLLGRNETVLFESYGGSYDSNTLINMASASKWPGGAAVAAAVAEGKLDPKAPLSSWKPALAETPKGALTLIQLMSFTAGAASVAEGTPDIRIDPRMDIQTAAEELLKLPLVSEPGTELAYGGWTQQIGAAWAVAATGEPFTKLWNRTVGVPARMTQSHFGHPRAARDGVDLPNPNLQAGLWTTPRDYSRFLMMMASGGKVNGEQVYPAAAITLIERDYANGLPHRWQGQGAEGGISYGFALWCEKATEDGTCVVMSCGGAWGTMPWLDREKNLWGLFMVYDRGPRVRADLDVLRGSAEAIALEKLNEDR